MHDIDFVVAWVDGSDPQWCSEKAKYQAEPNSRTEDVRYRDWENLHFWFRAVEQYAPWVRKVHFVTWGHLPKWLNEDHPKLHIVRHEDYIPKEYLPTFSSHPIELNMHRINGLAEEFVYFNDDTFLNAPVKPEDFFKNGQPVDRLIFDVVTPCGDSDSQAVFSQVVFNCVKVINQHFSKRDLCKKSLGKLLYPLYGSDVVKNLLLIPFGGITGFQNDHLPNAFLKSSLEDVWRNEGSLLERASCRKFRDRLDVSQYLFRYWQLAQGNVHPCSSKRGRVFHLSSNNEALFKALLKGDYKMICCNDDDNIDDFITQKEQLNAVFQNKLPLKSSYEI